MNWSNHCVHDPATLADSYMIFPGFYLDTEEINNLLPGFLGSIIGIRQGETRSFPLQFPESWEQENLRGVRAQFTVSVTLLSLRPTVLLFCK